MYFQNRKRVNDYDCDCNNEMKISAALRYMQQTSSEHMAWLGTATDKLRREDMVFLLSKMNIRVHRMPKNGEELMTGTTANFTKGVRFYREFTFDTVDGVRLVSALTTWFLANPTTHQVLRPSSYGYDMQFQPTVLGGAIGDVPIPKITEELVQTRTLIPIRYSHIDCNNHVNNGMYADFVCDCLPWEKLIHNGVETLVLNFRNEARHGETLEITAAQIDDNSYTMAGRHNETACFEAFVRLNAGEKREDQTA